LADHGPTVQDGPDSRAEPRDDAIRLGNLGGVGEHPDRVGRKGRHRWSARLGRDLNAHRAAPAGSGEECGCEQQGDTRTSGECVPHRHRGARERRAASAGTAGCRGRHGLAGWGGASSRRPQTWPPDVRYRKILCITRHPARLARTPRSRGRPPWTACGCSSGSRPSASPGVELVRRVGPRWAMGRDPGCRGPSRRRTPLRSTI
jgi:hypothetical protein